MPSLPSRPSSVWAEEEAPSPLGIIEVVARAQAAGVGTMVTISTPIRCARSGAGRRRALRRSIPVLGRRTRTPSREELDFKAADIVRLAQHLEGRGHRRSRPRLPLFPSKHEPQAEGFLSHRCRTPELACRSRSIRAKPTTTPYAFSRTSTPRAEPFPAILHCYTGGKSAWPLRAVELGLYVSASAASSRVNLPESLREIT